MPKFQSPSIALNRYHIEPADLILDLVFSAIPERGLTDPSLFPACNGQLRRSILIVGPHFHFAKDKNFAVPGNNIHLSPLPAVIQGDNCVSPGAKIVLGYPFALSTCI
jgi:hypothetical protein